MMLLCVVDNANMSSSLGVADSVLKQIADGLMQRLDADVRDGIHFALCLFPFPLMSLLIHNKSHSLVCCCAVKRKLLPCAVLVL